MDLGCVIGTIITSNDFGSHYVFHLSLRECENCGPLVFIISCHKKGEKRENPLNFPGLVREMLNLLEEKRTSATHSPRTCSLPILAYTLLLSCGGGNIYDSQE